MSINSTGLANCICARVTYKKLSFFDVNIEKRLSPFGHKP